MELQQQQRRLGQLKPCICIGGAHVQFVHQFDAGHGNTILDGGHDSLTGGFNRWKRHARGADRLGDALQFQGHLGDQAQCAFGTDKQAGQVIARRCLFRALRRTDNAAIGHNGLQRDNVVFHCAITHCVGARCTRGRHAAKRGIGPRINRKEQSAIPQISVQLFARDPRLHDAIKVVSIDGDDLVHRAHIHRNAARGRVHMPLKGCSRAIGNYRHAVDRADIDDVRHLLGRRGKDHGIGGLCFDISGGVCMLIAYRLACMKSVAKLLFQNAQCCCDAVFVAW